MIIKNVQNEDLYDVWLFWRFKYDHEIFNQFTERCIYSIVIL